MFSIDNLRCRSAALDAEIQYLQNYISSHPITEHLTIRKGDNDSFYYSKKVVRQEGGKKEKYLPQSEENEIKKLAYQKYAPLRLKDAIREKKAIERMIRVFSQEDSVTKYMQKHPGVYAMLKDWLWAKGDDDLLAPDDEIRRKAEAWKNLPYRRSQTNPEWLKYPTIIKGLQVRSKAEADIIGRFEHFGAAYHYEEYFDIPEHLLNLYRRNSFDIHPDFKCKNMRTGKVYWWEHQGQWDNPKYVADLPAREELLFQAGLVPWKNLIITTETQELPLDIQWVDEIIRFYLL